MLNRSAVGILLLVPLVAENTEAKVIRVSTTGDGSDPSTWEGALSSVGAAISATTAGDEIWVASGRYNESIQINQTGKNDVSLYGGFSGFETDTEFELRDWRSNETTLDATGLNDRVLAIDFSEQIILDGFIITGGRRFHEDVFGGSGISCRYSSVTLHNCHIHHNGEVPSRLGQFADNGGGLFCLRSQLVIDSCTFTNNIGASGGAICSLFSDIEMYNTLLDRNRTDVGAAFGKFVGDATVVNCTFGLFNVSLTEGRNEDFEGNGSNLFINCIMTKGAAGPREVIYSLTPSSTGNNNIDADPLFVDPENGDYRLQLNSPCIDAGTKVDLLKDLDGNPRPIDVVGRGHEGAFSYDMGAYEFQLKKSDLDKNGKVNAKDLLILQQEWRHDRPAGR